MEKSMATKNKPKGKGPTTGTTSGTTGTTGNTTVTSNGTTGTTGGTSSTTTRNQPPLAVNAQYVKDFSFENPNPLANLSQQQGAPGISINIEAAANRIQDRTYEVALKIKVDAKRETSKEAVFILELTYAGVFTIGSSVPEEMIRPILMIECPRILFPFARSIVANSTQEGGYPSLLLTPVDFADLYQQQMAAEQAKASSGKVASA